MITIRPGDSRPELREIQHILVSQGFAFEDLNPGIYTPGMVGAVKYFQATHIDPESKLPLIINGDIDDATYRAMEKPSGEDQRLHLELDRVPNGLTALRYSSISYKMQEWRKGVKEMPDGSNWGLDIQKYGGRKGWAWCALFGEWGLRDAGIKIPVLPSCHGLVRWAKQFDFFYPLDSTDPKAWIPGNLLMFYHDASSGHCTTIVTLSEDGVQMNTVGGNEGNRVAFRLRNKHEHGIVGTINPFPDTEQPLGFERGVVTKALGAPSVKETR